MNMHDFHHIIHFDCDGYSFKLYVYDEDLMEEEFVELEKDANKMLKFAVKLFKEKSGMSLNKHDYVLDIEKY
jgi:hypothetical protein